MADMVKCADCGFLAVRRLEDRQLVEVELRMRQTGQSPRNLNLPKVFYEILPICFKQAWPLHQETEPDQPDKFREVVQKERECSEFTAWMFGSTPKEHREMMDREKFLDWQARREDSDQTWRAHESRQNRIDQRNGIVLQIIITSLVAILAAFLSGYAQATFQKDTVINNTIVAPTPQPVPSVSTTPTSPTPTATRVNEDVVTP